MLRNWGSKRMVASLPSIGTCWRSENLAKVYLCHSIQESWRKAEKNMCNKNGLKLIHHTGDVSMHVDGSNILRKGRDTVYIWFLIYTYILYTNVWLCQPRNTGNHICTYIYTHILHHDTFSLNKNPSMIVRCEVTPIPAGGKCYCQPQWRKWKPWLSDWMDVHQIIKEKGVTNLGDFF